MKNRIFNLLILTLFFQFSIMAQSLETHLWQDRIILLFAPNSQNITLQKQLGSFEKNKKGLKERKLLVYQITPNGIKKNGIDFPKKELREKLNKEYQINNNEFTFVLVGLDGGEKMRSTKLVSIEKLFGKIDRMPMRRAEKNN